MDVPSKFFFFPFLQNQHVQVQHQVKHKGYWQNIYGNVNKKIFFLTESICTIGKRLFYSYC